MRVWHPRALALRKGVAFFYHRSAGACPPRVSSRAQHSEGQALALRKGAAFFIVARGPVPRERWIARTMTGWRFMKHPHLSEKCRRFSLLKRLLQPRVFRFFPEGDDFPAHLVKHRLQRWLVNEIGGLRRILLHIKECLPVLL